MISVCLILGNLTILARGKVASDEYLFVIKGNLGQAVPRAS